MLSQAPAEAKLIPHWRVVEQMWNAYFWVEDVEALYLIQKTRCQDRLRGGTQTVWSQGVWRPDLDDHDMHLDK